jgi:two-component system CheB/CheR fusion protein
MKSALQFEQHAFGQAPIGDSARQVHAADRRLLAVMSHELKQSLAELMLHTDELLHPTIYPAGRKPLEIGRAMQAAVMRQARIIDDLSELSRIHTGKLRLDLSLVDIAGLTREACRMAARKAPGIEMEFEMCRTEQFFCMADPVRIEQILSNLLGNAIKFCEGKGRINVGLAVDRGHARISVTDTGCGIAAEFLPHVFSMFEQEHPSSVSTNTGMGIGLALVQELATAHGGQVLARSEGPGRGAQFVVWLPLKGCAMPSGSNAPGTTVPLPAASRRSPLAYSGGAEQATP